MNNLVENNDWEFEWDFCHERLQSKRDLILRKLVHTEKVKFCVYFSLGKSDYGEECWISHDLSCKSLWLNSNVFWVKHRRRRKHYRNVTICKDDRFGACQYVENCWFKHDDDNQKKEAKQQLKMWLYQILEMKWFGNYLRL